MKTYSVSQARENFADILDAVERGEDVTITKHGATVATITRPAKAKKSAALPPPGFLHAQGWSVTMADDFDAIPEGFEDYI
jgi:prevent-host-death family protein